MKLNIEDYKEEFEAYLKKEDYDEEQLDLARMRFLIEKK